MTIPKPSWSEVGLTGVIQGGLDRAFDEGRATAMQGLGLHTCPYLAQSENDYFEAWNRGFQSFGDGHTQAL